MKFAYQARDPLGNTQSGSIEAETLEEASQKLSDDGYQILQMDEERGEFTLVPKRVKRSEVIYVTTQLAVMVDTGINLASALDGIAEQETNPTLRKVLDDLRARVEAGEDFSAALSRYPKFFDRTYVAMVCASEHSGSLGSMLDRIASYMRSQMEARNKVYAAMAYPSVMLVLAISVTVFLLTFVLPKFAPLFTRKGVDLPKPTMVMMTLSDAMLEYWYAWIIGLIVGTIGFLAFRKTNPGRKLLDGVKLHLPVLGKLFRKITLSRSIRTLGTMIESGVPMLDAIQLSSQVAANHHYERSWHRVEEQVTQGNRISDALQNDPLFPRTLVQMIRSGEETGKLDEVLQKVSRYYDREVETSLKATTSLIEPVMITVMGVIVGGIGLSLLLPIFSLSRTPG